jgi:ornithine cyclodeaminase
MQIRILTATDVQKALPMPKAIEKMKSAFGQFSAGKAQVPLRTRLHTDKGVTLIMPAYLSKSRDLAVKIVSVYGDNPTRNLPTVAATVLALDPDTGLPLALMEGDALTALRTGAAGGLAADLLARRDASRVALFGAGIQARSQLAAVMAVRSVTSLKIVERSPTAAQKLTADLGASHPGLAVSIAVSPREAVQDAHIVLAATTTRTPLFDGNDLRPGTHVTGVGSFTPEMQEIDATTIARARVVVDSREACLAEAGDIIMAKAAIHAELGQIVNGDEPGRLNDTEITFFKSVGLAAQDAAAAAEVLAQARQNNLGTLIDMSG